MFKKISVKPNFKGFLFKNNSLSQKLDPGIYFRFSLFDNFKLVSLPQIPRLLNVVNQEVITKDNVSLRFSYYLEYQIVNFETALNNFDFFMISYAYNQLMDLESYLHNTSQVLVRELISVINSEDLNDKRSELSNDLLKINELTSKYGININSFMIKDIQFPKNIQNVFASQLESKIRAKAELENARTTVASARALKNASEIVKDDENIRFFQMLETMNKIASKGSHTFVFGDFKLPSGNSPK